MWIKEVEYRMIHARLSELEHKNRMLELECSVANGILERFEALVRALGLVEQIVPATKATFEYVNKGGPERG